MFKKKINNSSDKVDTMIGEGTEFNGSIVTNGTIRVDGKVEGEVTTEGDIIIGETGKVKANAKGKNITIAGEINGNIEGTGKLELLPTAKLLGDIKVDDLYVDSGAIFQGNCEMKQKQNKETSVKEGTQ